MLKVRQATPNNFSNRSGHISVMFGRYMLVWGGFNCQNGDLRRDNYIPSHELAVYDTVTYHWERKTSKLHLNHPVAISAACALILDNYLYIICGHTINGHSNYVSRLHLTLGDLQWEPMHPVSQEPSPRDKFTCWTLNKKIYCFGGFGPHFASNIGWLSSNGSYQADELEYHWLGWNNQLMIFDPETCEWSNPPCKGHIPLPRAAHCTVLVGHTVYLFGGRHKRCRMNDLYSFDVNTLTWLRLYPEKNGDVPAGRSWCSLTAVSSTTLILYGGYTINEQPLGDAWMLDLEVMTWHRILIPSTWPRLWHTACLSLDGSILIYGGCSSNVNDSSRLNDHCGDVLELRISPKSLCSLCLEAAFEYRECTKSQWSSLPKDLQKTLEARFKVWVDDTFHSNIDNNPYERCDLF